MATEGEKIIITIVCIVLSILLLGVTRKEFKEGKTTSRNQVCHRNLDPLGFWFTIIFRLVMVILMLYAVYGMHTS